MASITTVINNLQHPKVVEAFLLSPTFTSKLPSGIQLFLRPHYPVVPAASASPEAAAVLKSEKFTWAIVDERAGTHTAFIVAAAIVDLTITDADLDALDAATAQGLSMTLVDGKPAFTVGGAPAPENAVRVLDWILTAASLADATGTRLVMSNGPRWVLVSAGQGVKVSRSSGKRADGTKMESETSMFGGLVGLAFEEVVTRDARASLEAARAARK